MGFRNLREYSQVVELAPIFAYRSEDKIRRFIDIAKLKEDRERDVIGFRPINDNWEHLSNEENAVFSRIAFWWNHKLVQNSTNKKLNGIFLYSNDTSLGKTSFCETISALSRVYFYCRTDNSWQEKYDMDAKGDYSYNALIIDGLQDKKDIDFAILEDISNHDVLIKRRGKVGGTLTKGTAFAITSNLSHFDLFGNQADIISARSMVINCTGVPLFPMINHIREIHNLPAYVTDNTVIPQDLL